MTQPFDPRALQFFMTLPTECPYLPGRQERKIFTQIDPAHGFGMNDYLTHAGFRRSQNVLYRPACENCRECRSLRVPVKTFNPTRSMRRVLRKNLDLRGTRVDSVATHEQFNLLQRYLSFRHPDGGMSDMDFTRYEMMTEDTYSATEIIEYRDMHNTLVACVITDNLLDGLSMVYSFFDPEQKSRGLGNFMILDGINMTKAMGLDNLYLGYWVNGSPKMDYKAKFQPCEILGPRGWIPLKHTPANIKR